MICRPPVLEFRAVSKTFQTPRGGVPVLRGVNVSIQPGEFVAITGPSGSGKSTFLNVASLLDQPTSGQVLFEGREVSSLDEAGLSEIRKRRIGMVFQKFCLLPHRSAIENVMFRYRYLDVAPDEVERRSVRALEELGLRHIMSQPARLLSGGEMQRVAIARAVALRPAVLLADEPTGNLDGDSAAAVMEAFRVLHQAGISLLMATHNETLLRHCTRHLVCRDGSFTSVCHDV